MMGGILRELANLNNYLLGKGYYKPPVPDVFPDASMVCTLLIKLGLTFKKVC